MLPAPSLEQQDRRALALVWRPRPWIGPLPEKVPLARRSAALIAAAATAVVLVDRYGLPDWLA